MLQLIIIRLCSYIWLFIDRVQNIEKKVGELRFLHLKHGKAEAYIGEMVARKTEVKQRKEPLAFIYTQHMNFTILTI